MVHFIFYMLFLNRRIFVIVEEDNNRIFLAAFCHLTNILGTSNGNEISELIFLRSFLHLHHSALTSHSSLSTKHTYNHSKTRDPHRQEALPKYNFQRENTNINLVI